ncbi:GNAT family N-acetyltransferase [Hoeflea sp. WL0058]|uniref:GNAT family N-acetyltransferase n=1 Tax=Flavimaribacter sediminis TaxID=2865987 RepID=A0AAE2ZJT1_9HYPH|nr:GNAT family N-acetyltransferase [Flavimaribacter sediminis]MBW8637481.1 GNAT family N-acetyltransferase [Flavimaribacter sediminis]
MTTQTAAITRMTVDDFERRIDDFATVLHACVHAGANVNFVLPFSREDSAAFWMDKVAPALANGKRVLWAAMENERVAGTVQLDYDTPPNQPHRAEVTKLLVHPDFRRRGLAKALMAELETEAQRLGRSLITLDTRTGDKAEPLYASLGYQTVGIIPDFCVDPIENRLHPTTIMYKAL